MNILSISITGLFLLSCTPKKKIPESEVHIPDGSLIEQFVGIWADEDGNRLLITQDSVSKFEHDHWISQTPILSWEKEGPILCHQGQPLSQGLKLEDQKLSLLDGGHHGGLSRLPDSAKIPSLAPKEFLQNPPELSPLQISTIRSELGDRVQIDQEARSDESIDMEAVDAENQAWIEKTIDEVGWIDVQRFGLQASQDAWILVQHSNDLRLLMAVEEQVKGVEGLESNWALLNDRIAARQGKPQRFGSQLFVRADGRLTLLPVTDPDQVVADRNTLGLQPWSEYLGLFDGGKEILVLDCTENPTQTVPAKPPK